MTDEQLRGRFVWHALLTTDTHSAESFYQRVVGWSTKAWSHDNSYTLFMAGDRPVAGLIILPEDAKNMGAPPHWLTYIGTPNVDDTAQRAAELGGRVLRPAEDIPSAGRFAIVQDPQGAVFGLYSPAQPQPGTGEAQPSIGDFSWHELATDNWTTAWPFYQTLFGWEKTSSMDMGPEMGIYQMFGRGGQSVGGMFKRPPNVPACWMPYAMIEDARAAAEVVARLGGHIVNGPMEVPGGDLIAQGLDLQGAAFAVHSRKVTGLAGVEAAPALPTRKKTAGTSPKPARKAKRPSVRKTAAKKAPAKRAPVKKAPVKKAKVKKAKVKKPKARKPASRKVGKPRTARKAAKRPTRAAARSKPTRAATSKKRVATKKKAKKAVRRSAGKNRPRQSARRAAKKR